MHPRANIVRQVRGDLKGGRTRNRVWGGSSTWHRAEKSKMPFKQSCGKKRNCRYRAAGGTGRDPKRRSEAHSQLGYATYPEQAQDIVKPAGPKESWDTVRCECDRTGGLEPR